MTQTDEVYQQAWELLEESVTIKCETATELDGHVVQIMDSIDRYTADLNFAEIQLRLLQRAHKKSEQYLRISRKGSTLTTQVGLSRYSITVGTEKITRRHNGKLHGIQKKYAPSEVSCVQIIEYLEGEKVRSYYEPNHIEKN
jgi:hypothetical protein